MSFVLRDASVSFANAMRRIAMSEVPTFAVEDVTVYENNSVLFDEYISNRLALVPLTTDYSYKADCCGNCSKCTVMLTLDAEGPKTVYSGDLKSGDKNVVPASAKIPLLKLLQGQRVRLEAKARLGTAKEHAKFQPGIAAYSYYPRLDLQKGSLCADCKARLAGKIKKIVDGERVDEPHSFVLCKQCEKEFGASALKIAGDPSAFVFRVESFGQVSAPQLMEKAAETMEAKCKEFDSQLKKLFK